MGEHRELSAGEGMSRAATGRVETGGDPPARIDTDVLVVGAGLAGLRVARELSARGHAVLLCDRRADLGASIRTTGIFVRRTLDDFDLPETRLGPAIRRVHLYPPASGAGPAAPLELVSDRDEYRVGDMSGLYLDELDRARAAGVRVLLRTRFTGRTDGGYLLARGPERLRVRARFLVGADGARSRVARELGLDRNTQLLVGAEDVSPVREASAEPVFHCVLDPVLAPGYLAWVVDDGEHLHVGTAGYSARFPGGARRALERFRAQAPGLRAEDREPADVERRGGPIPVGGLLRRISSPAGLLVGDAAGAVSPLTAGGLDPCLRLSDYAVDCLDDALRASDPGVLAHYDGAFLRRKFAGRVAMRQMLALVRHRRVMRVGFAALRTPAGEALARRIMFADRSFPDTPAVPASALSSSLPGSSAPPLD
jgi:flavin-dependent dehydrogenase